MIGAIRLLTFGSRGAWTRLVIIAAGVASGVLVALMLIAGSNALEARDLRGAWLHPSGVAAVSPAPDSAPEPDMTVVASGTDLFEGKRITRLDVTVPATGAQIPGIDDPPGPGEFFTSPALTALIEAHPAEALAERYGRFAGEIPEHLLPSPDTLAVIVGADPATVAAFASAITVESFDPQLFGGNQNYQTLAAVGAIALLLPALLLVAVATSLGAAARSERTQTLRIMGAPKRLLVAAAVLEAGVSAGVGALLGAALFFLLRPLLAQLRVAGERLVASDLTVGMIPSILVMVLVIAGSVAAAGWSAIRSPAHATATRAVFERAPTAWRLVPFLCGLFALVGIQFAGGVLPLPASLAVIVCFVVLAVGLVIAGPFIVYATGRIYAAVASSGPGVLASRRIVRTPAAVFRSVAGLVAATFLVSLFATAVTARVDAGSFDARALLPSDAVALQVLSSGSNALGLGLGEIEDELAALRLGDGIRDVVVAYGDLGGLYLTAEAAARLGAADVPDGQLVSVNGGVFSLAPGTPALSPVSDRSVAEVLTLPVGAIVVRTDGDAESIERARTALLLLPGVDPSAGALTRGEYVANADTSLATQFAEIGRFAIIVATVLAAAVLIIATVAALYDRRRTLALLRLIGMPAQVMRGFIVREMLVPLIGVTVIAAAAGCFTAWLLVAALSTDRTIGWPDALMPIALAATAVMAVFAIWIATVAGRRLLQREQLRFE